MSNLRDKVAIVTGGSRGIGFAVAQALLQRGAKVVITGTQEQALARAAGDLEKIARDAPVLPVRADVRRYGEVEQLMQTTAARFGGIDVLVNNAGVGIWRSVADMTVDEWHQVIDTNLSGVFYCCHAALPYLRARGGGWIINISSLASKHALVDGAAYCASKSGLNAFSEAFMQEVRYDGVRVAYVLPGSVRTGFRGASQSEDQWKLAPDDVAE
jgi:NAD(P)-dependent dehydrogenase (short-subunit alcohol dehydrogenase family)